MCLYSFFSRFVGYEMGNGSKTRFWHDLWCGDQPLKVTFLELLSMLRCKKAWVAYHVQFSNGNIQ
jgi:hypothetical protein